LKAPATAAAAAVAESREQPADASAGKKMSLFTPLRQE
jgi:hypothetical protein